MNYRTLITLMMALATMISSCKTGTNNSDVKERWDSKNGPELFEAKTVNYDLISKSEYKSGELKDQPWSDTYWPLNAAGFAYRWIDKSTHQSLAQLISADPSNSNYQTVVREQINKALETVRVDSDKTWQEAVGISPAEKYDIAVGDASFALTQNELESFASNKKGYEEIDWGWMGHCHGWAPASFLYKAPKHAVLMSSEATGKKALFTQGDIRGVLTKAAADNNFTKRVRFMGTRCNDSYADIPRDKLNRIVDGLIGTWNSSTKSFTNSRSVRVLHNNWFGFNELNGRNIEMVLQFGPSFQNSAKYWMTATRWNDQANSIVEVMISSTKVVGGELVKDQVIASSDKSVIGQFHDSNDQFVVDGSGTPVRDEAKAKALWDKVTFDIDPTLKDPSNWANFRYYKECRDLNPGSFHTVLARYLSKGAAQQGVEPHSFVLDVTRDEQVWNHAIYTYESRMGTPTPVVITEADGKQSKDPFRKWRAPGTEKIVDVFTYMVYAIENGPYINPTKNQDALNAKMYHYTLELNKKGDVIGGEWHGMVSEDRSVADLDWVKHPLSGKALHQELRKIALSTGYQAKVDSPDFIWTYDKGTEVGSGDIIKADFVKKLYECSISEGTTELSKVTVAGQETSYSECTY